MCNLKGSCCNGGMCKCAQWAPLILRVVVGIVFFAHGAQKLLGWFGGSGIAGTTGFLAQLGFAGAGFWAWVLALVEFFGGLALFFGVLTSVAAVLLAINMLVAMFTVHIKNGFFLAKGGIEFALVLFAMVVALAFSGAGKWSIDRMRCKNCKEPEPTPPTP